MPNQKRIPFSAFLMGAAATLARPFLRRSREAVPGSGQPAAPSKLDTRKWTPELLKQLEWRRFEELCAAYFETLGFRTRIAHSGTEGGVDIHLCAGGAENASILVQCRAWNAYRVGTKAVLELRGALSAAKVGEGMLVTSGRFTQEAVDLARKENIQLIDGAGLLGKIAALLPEKALALLKFATQGDFLTPTCPRCSIKMISRKSTNQGRKFWGCRNYPQCKQTLPANVPA